MPLNRLCVARPPKIGAFHDGAAFDGELMSVEQRQRVGAQQANQLRVEDLAVGPRAGDEARPGCVGSNSLPPPPLGVGSTSLGQANAADPRAVFPVSGEPEKS